MSLFKKNILKEYNVLNYVDGALNLHCSKNDMVIAPITGKAKIDGSTIILKSGNKEIKIMHVTPSIKSGDVKAGDEIGAPIIQNGRATIRLSVVIDGKEVDALTYLKRQDKEKAPSKKKKSSKKVDVTIRPTEAEVVEKVIITPESVELSEPEVTITKYDVAIDTSKEVVKIDKTENA